MNIRGRVWVASRLKSLINRYAGLDIKLKSGEGAYSAQPDNRILIGFEQEVNKQIYKEKILAFIDDKLGLKLDDTEIGCSEDYLIIQGNQTFQKLGKAIVGLQRANLSGASKVQGEAIQQ